MTKSCIFGDGENLVVFFKGVGKAEFAYTFEAPIITEIQITQDNELDEMRVSSNKGIGKRVFVPTQQSKTRFEINGACLGDKTKVESSDNGGLIPQLKIFKNVTISELFLAINRKLNERKKNETSNLG